MKDTIVNSAARAVHAMAWANLVEEVESKNKKRKGLSSLSQQNILEVAPPTPACVVDQVRSLIEQTALIEWAEKNQDAIDARIPRKDYVTRLGHVVGCVLAGAGVGFADDNLNELEPPELPELELNYYRIRGGSVRAFMSPGGDFPAGFKLTAA